MPRTTSQVLKTFQSARFRVWVFIRQHPGCTDGEIRDGLGLNKNTARPRRIELEHAGLVELVLPMKRDTLGNVSERWRATEKPYPEHWPTFKASDGTALAIRAARRLKRWAQFKNDTKLIALTTQAEQHLLKGAP